MLRDMMSRSIALHTLHSIPFIQWLTLYHFLHCNTFACSNNVLSSFCMQQTPNKGPKGLSVFYFAKTLNIILRIYQSKIGHCIQI